MKSIIISMAITAFAFTACNSNTDKSAENKNSTTDTGQAKSQTDNVTATTPSATDTKATFSIKETVTAYLQLKNALANDNTKDAATAGNAIVAELAKVDMKSLSKEQMKSYMDIEGDTKENAEHIGANAGKLDHQREHFVMLSKDMADLIKTFGNGGQTLYKDYCPMANDGKGAIWISEVKEIKNPYLGSKMPTCGTMKEEIK